MKLITNFHDYYDTPFRHSAVDPKHIFKRETSSIEIPHVFSRFIYSRNLSQLNTEHGVFFKGFIGFCGKFYPFITFHPLGNPKEIFYTSSELTKKHSNLFYDDTKDRRLRGCTDTIQVWCKWLDTGIIKNWSDSYELHKDQQLFAFFEKHKTAYFLVTGENWKDIHSSERSKIMITLYPNLKDYQFFKIFDTYHAFQAIEQYLTNNLVKPDMIEIKIPDKLKAESKGFDKWSFRKMSEKS